MRVALLTCNARSHDAIGQQVAEKLAFFLDSGADVRVFVEDEQRLHSFVRPHSRLLDPREPKGEGWKYLTSADLVIADYSQSYALLGLLPLLAGGKPHIVLDYHGVTPAEFWNGPQRQVLADSARQRGLVWCADAALAHSRFTRRELLEQTHFPQERIFALGYPVPAEQWSPVAPACRLDPRSDLRIQLGIGSATLLLYVGRLAPNKRVPLLVETLALLRERTPPVHAVVIGDITDVYEEEAYRCRELADELGVAERLHLLGQLNAAQLRDAYRSADVFVMPSRHEGFCIPVIEAMACGLPVVAASAAALPETVGHAGLTFKPDDALDLARQVRRVIDPSAPSPPGTPGGAPWATGRGEGGQTSSRHPSPHPLTPDPGAHGAPPEHRGRGETEARPVPSVASPRVAIVSARYGTDFVGGAERSLRTIAETLWQAGHVVEVFTTCANTETNWTDHHAEGTELIGDVPVRRFRIDRHDRARHMEAVRTILQASGPVPAQVVDDYLAHSIHSSVLMAELGQRIDEFDAVITGPYLLGLTHDVARAHPHKTLLLPCFHDEPFARLRVWREAYEQVGGILYHSPEEQDLAGRKLGFNHAGGSCLGTWIDTDAPGDAERGRQLVGGHRPYVVYCGRYSMQKGVPALLDCARRYAQQRPERFRFVFMGEGSVTIPREPWARDLGFVDEAAKRDVLAGAAALVQLSRCESLSLTALEAWAQGVPVIANRQCAVLLGHLQRGGGGQAVDDSEALALKLDDLHDHGAAWQELGRRGQAYVCRYYGSSDDFRAHLEQSIHELSRPLAERMRQRGFKRASTFDRPAWRRRFAECIENILDAPPRTHREHIDIVPRTETRHAAAGTGTVLVPVRVVNQGTHAAVADGPARVLLVSATLDDTGGPRRDELVTSLPRLLLPGQSLAIALPVSVPDGPGSYGVAFEARFAPGGHNTDPPVTPPLRTTQLTLIVEQKTGVAVERVCAPLLENAQSALAEAYKLQHLPDDYVDVTAGRFAAWKRWLKQKVLGNFKRAYVDVLSRQQSDFNQQVLGALNELAECCATLDHAARRPSTTRADHVPSAIANPDELAHLLRDLVEQLNDSRRQCAQLQARLERMEATQSTS